MWCARRNPLTVVSIERVVFSRLPAKKSTAGRPARARFARSPGLRPLGRVRGGVTRHERRSTLHTEPFHWRSARVVASPLYPPAKLPLAHGHLWTKPTAVKPARVIHHHQIAVKRQTPASVRRVTPRGVIRAWYQGVVPGGDIARSCAGWAGTQQHTHVACMDASALRLRQGGHPASLLCSVRLESPE